MSATDSHVSPQPKLGADILGQGLPLQQTLEVLPDSAVIAGFLRRALGDIPGVVDVHLYVAGAVVPPSDEFEAFCAEHQAAWETSNADSDGTVGGVPVICLPLHTARHGYGMMLLSIGNAEALSPYRVFLQNFARGVARTFETREYVQQLDATRVGLETQVAERTSALKESTERFRNMVETVSDWLWEVDENGVYTFCSAKVRDLLGYEPQDLIGKSPFDLMPAAEAARVAAIFGAVVAERKPLLALENTNLHKDGREVVLETSGAPVFDAAGAFKGYRGIDRDITERKRAQREALEQFKLAETFFNHSVSSLVILDRHFNFVRVNQAYATACRREIGEFAGRNHFEMYPSDTQAIFEDVVRSKRPFTTFTRAFVFADQPERGTTYWDWTLVPILDEQGEVEYLVFSLTEVTERKRAEVDHLIHLHFLESMDRINRATQGSHDLESMMSDVLAVALSIFDCDRAWLLYPCDPDAPSFRVPMEVTKPEYPGAKVLNVDIPMSPGEAANMREALGSDAPVTYTAGTERPVSTAKQFGVQSQIFVPVHPKFGKPWVLGLHQCSHPRLWTVQEKRLFQEIGRRLADALTSMLVQRDLQRSEDFLSKVVENIPNMVFVKEAQSLRLVRLNKAGEQFLGYRQEELRGKNDYDLFSKEAADFFTAKDREALGAEGVVDIPEETVRTADQRARVLHTKKIRILGSDGKPQYLLGIAEDITERKQAEAVRTQLAAIVQSSHDAIIGMDLDGVITSWNPGAEEIYGYGAPEVIGKSVAMLAPTDKQEETRDRIVAVERGQAAGDVETQRIRKDGRRIDVVFRVAPIKDGADRTVGASAIVRDITEKKQSERALKALGNCNMALVHASDERQLLNEICRVIVDTGGYCMAWVGQPEQDAAKTVRPIAHHGHEDGYLAATAFSWADSELGRGPTGTAIRTGSVQLNRNFATDPALAPWREQALARGYRASMALPLKSAMGLLGVLTIYATEPDAFNEAEVSLLQELAEDLAFGIQTLRARLEHERVVHQHLHHAEILRQSLEDSIKAIANTVEMRDPYTAGHQRRVGQLAVAIAREFGLPEDTNHGIELAASIHDLGKISVPAEILSKPGKLTSIEMRMLQNHAQAGFDILKDIQFPWPIASMVLQHHERLDGTGYPQGLKGEQILLESRILAVADVVEAMASHRPYRPALGVESALQEIERGRGTAYDAAVVDACLRLFARKRFVFSE